MPAQVTNYKCPSCTGPLHFAGGAGRLECEYCGSTYDPEEIERLYAEKDRAAAETAEAARENSDSEGQWQFSEEEEGWGAEEGIHSYQCPSCGAELLCDETTAAVSCPYCGNPAIVPGQFSGTRRPDFVIPFRLDKEAAIKALKAHYRGKRFLPKAFADSNHLKEIKGVYVPFWLFDGEADADVQFQATISHRHREGKELVTDTMHYLVHRAGSVCFEKIPVDASSKMPDDYMDSLEPFDYADLKPFSTAFLPGYLADKYDVSQEESTERAENRACQTAVEAMRASVTGYETCVTTQKEVCLRRGKVWYALFPVWLLSTKWNGRDFLFAMNGQTGKMVGNLPMAWGKFWAWFAGISIPLAGILTGIRFLVL